MENDQGYPIRNPLATARYNFYTTHGSYCSRPRCKIGWYCLKRFWSALKQAPGPHLMGKGEERELESMTKLEI